MLKQVLKEAVRRLRGEVPVPGAAKRAIALLDQGDAEGARAVLVAALDQAPRDIDCLAALGWTCRALGDAAGAGRHARRALELRPDTNSAHLLLATLELPGAHYLELLRHIHERLRPRTYFEIGVFTGRSIALVGPETDVIGIDPEPKLAAPPGPRTRILALTSDDYFARHDLTAEFGGRPVELALIDGMHNCEFALRDFANLERHCSPQGTVLIHDGHPVDEATSARERRTEFWTGDIWRTVLALRKYRPDLVVRTLASPPSGLTVVRGLDPGSRVLHERMAEIEADMLATPYSALGAAKSALLGVVPGDRATLDALLASSPA